jgi:aryl-alcohol dehydrogenase-like predicted oxidoreductase
MNTALRERCFGKSGLAVGPMGIGTWAIGGPFHSGEGCHYPTGTPLGYGQVDDAESLRAIHCAVDLGAKLFDTADAYGTGHGERILGRALKEKRGQVMIATKFGNTYDEDTKELTGTDVSPDYIRRACEASLKRLQTDWIDLYQLHVGDLPIEHAGAVADTLDELCDEGLIRTYAWSTDDPERGAVFANRPRAVAVQFDMNVFEDAPKMLEVCDTHDFAGIVRVPLAMGFLSGKFTGERRLPRDDIRSRPPAWLRYFEDGGRAAAHWTERLDSIKEILSSGGRTLAQGALAWVWGRSERMIPIPGIRTVAQVQENLGAIQFGPLDPDRMREIDSLLERRAT